MLHKRRTLVLALAIVCASGACRNVAVNPPGPDLCVTFSGGGTHVGKAFPLRIPAVGLENTCAPFNGVELGGLQGGITGTGCVTSNGGAFLLHYSYHGARSPQGAESYFESGFCRFEFHSQINNIGGFCRGTILTSNLNGKNVGQSAYHQGATLSFCSPPASDVVEPLSP
jgi:hypothetical protein